MIEGESLRIWRNSNEITVVMLYISLYWWEYTFIGQQKYLNSIDSNSTQKVNLNFSNRLIPFSIDQRKQFINCNYFYSIASSIICYNWERNEMNIWSEINPLNFPHFSLVFTTTHLWRWQRVWGSRGQRWIWFAFHNWTGLNRKIN